MNTRTDQPRRAAAGTVSAAAISPPTKATGLYRHLLSSLKEQWKRYRRKLRRCRKDFSEEAVHDLRVELRRLLSSVELTGAFLSARRREKTRRLLKKHLDWFGGLRDAHVQLPLLDKSAARFAAARRFRDEVRLREQHFLREADSRLRRFKPSRLKRALERIRREIKDRCAHGLEAHDLAATRQALRRAFAQTLRRRRRVDRRRRETIHRTRIAFKHYRYIVEALVPLLGGVSQRQLQAMHDHQTLMGNVQDMEVLCSTFENSAPPGEMTTPSSRAFRNELKRRLRAAVSAYWARADDLLEFRPNPAALAVSAKGPTTS